MNKNLILIVALVAAIAAVTILMDEEEPGEPTLPNVSIVTDSGEFIYTDESYTKCSVSVWGGDGDFTLDAENAKIRGRGNSTWDQPSWWYMPKKPYKVMFDEPIDMFGNGAARKWTFIANYSDPSLSRDYFAYTIGAAIGLEDTTTVQCVNLYLNDIYQGEYLMCEQVEIGEGRVDIDVGPIDGDYGFLTEMDAWILSDGVEGLDYFWSSGNVYSVHWPDDEPYDSAYGYVDFARRWIDDAMDAIRSGDYDRASEMVDMESFALTYIVNELFHTQDVQSGSFYMYRSAGGKLISGPIWDFDNSSGNASNSTSKHPDRLWAADQNIWYRELLKYDEFRELVGEKLSETKDTISETIQSDREYLLSHKGDFKRNFDRWSTLGTLTGANPLEFLVIDTWTGHLDYLCNWLDASLRYLMSVYCPDA